MNTTHVPPKTQNHLHTVQIMWPFSNRGMVRATWTTLHRNRRLCVMARWIHWLPKKVEKSSTFAPVWIIQENNSFCGKLWSTVSQSPQDYEFCPPQNRRGMNMELLHRPKSRICQDQSWQDVGTNEGEGGAISKERAVLSTAHHFISCE
jgi:hypothetical protein